jgi:hypothetical protein
VTQTEPTAAAQPLAYEDPDLRHLERREAFGREFHFRQLIFACGMALTLGGFGYAAGRYTRTNSETPFCTTMGGLLIGIAVPIPRHARH